MYWLYARTRGDAGAMLTVYKVQEGMNEPHELAIAETARVLKTGGLALIPTETVYGVAVAVSAFAEGAIAPKDAELQTARSFIARPAATLAQAPALDQAETVNGAPVPARGTGYRRIFTLKQRDLAQTVAWLVEDERALDAFGADVSPEARVLARAFWPGALTIVVKAAPCVPAFMQAPDGTVALRASSSPVAQALVRATGPLACTSSNTHGMSAPAAFADVEPRILAGVDIAIDAGTTPCRDASTIVSFAAGELQILRQGALAASDIEAALKGGQINTPTNLQR